MTIQQSQPDSRRPGQTTSAQESLKLASSSPDEIDIDTTGELGLRPDGTIVMSNPPEVRAQDGGATNSGADQTGDAPYGETREKDADA